MEDVLCDISAFRYHRTPPYVLNLLPPVPSPCQDRRRLALAKHPLVSHDAKPLVHLLVRDKSHYRKNQSIQTHLTTGDLPFGSIIKTPLGVKVTSPLFTLLQMAGHLPVVQLTMAMYELCGTFAVFKPSETTEAVLAQAADLKLDLHSTWKRVKDASGTPTDLWQRPPLIEIDELQRFATKITGMHNYRRFQEAADYVTGVAASPFEAQLSMLLALPRKLGGEGFAGLSNNARIPLSRKATRIAGRSTCYADILFESSNDKRPLIVECQGKLIHNNPMSLMSDSDRMAALQEMGYSVLPLTYGQICDVKNFDTVKRHIAREIGIGYQEKSTRQLKIEQELRRNLLIDWNTLGM